MSQLKFYNNWGLYWLTTHCTNRMHILYKWGHSYPKMCLTRDRTPRCRMLCICACGGGGGGACMKTELGVNVGRFFLTVCFWFLQQMSVHDSSICLCITPLILPWGDVFIHPDLNCRYQNTVLIIYTLCTNLVSPVLVPFTALCQTFFSKQFVSSHVRVPYLHNESPHQQKCNDIHVCNLHNGFVDEMHAELRYLQVKHGTIRRHQTLGNYKLRKSKVNNL